MTKRNSDARKEQNRIASRAYRERRKQRLALLGKFLDKERGKHPSDKPTVAPQADETNPPSSEQISQPPSVGSQANPSAPLVCEDLSFDSPWPVPLNDHLSSHVLERRNAPSLPIASPTLRGLLSGSPKEQALREPFMSLTDSETRRTQSTEQEQLQPEGPSWEVLPRQTAPSFSALGQLLQLLDQQQVPYSHGRFTHSRSYSSTSGSGNRDESFGPFMEHLRSLQVPSVQRVIYVQQNSLFAAVMDNTLAIGCLQGMQLMWSEDGNSPFNKDWAVVSDGSGLRRQLLISQIRSQFAAAPKDLQPVDEQITMDHHIYLDVVPFPTFRQRALQALAHDPPLFDEYELCEDISNNNGLVVWGSLGNDQGMEACRPWDMRSWEPKPWFLRKYSFLVGGWDDDMWKAARWWHAMRNERIGSAGPPPSGRGCQ